MIPHSLIDYASKDITERYEPYFRYLENEIRKLLEFHGELKKAMVQEGEARREIIRRIMNAPNVEYYTTNAPWRLSDHVKNVLDENL